MIDSEGFRPNVGIILTNNRGKLLWARRIGQEAWQFPQGGISRFESPEQALYRELEEEIGLTPDKVELLACTKDWLQYRIPDQYNRAQNSFQPKRAFIGQKQKWFLLKLLVPDQEVRVDSGRKPEFDRWCWVSYWYPLSQIVEFKREVYRQALEELEPHHERLLQSSGGGRSVPC